MRNKYSKFWKKRRILVTGHEGFLGSWLVKELVRRGAQVVGVDIVRKSSNPILKDVREKIKSFKFDIANQRAVVSIINKYKPTTIFHLAAQALVDEAVKHPVRTFQSNIKGTWNILEAARVEKSIQAIVIASSDKAYGSHTQLPYKEEAYLKGIYPYDVSKACADLLAYSYFKTYNVPACVTRCGNIFGPGDLHFSRIVPDAIRSIVKNKRLIIRSDGRFTRDYIYVEDIVRGYILLAEKIKKLKIAGQAFNFSNEQPFTVLELFSKISALSGRPNSKSKILNKAKYEIRHQYLSAQKARKILGWRSKYTLDDSLRKTINWYQDFLRSK